MTSPGCSARRSGHRRASARPYDEAVTARADRSYGGLSLEDRREDRRRRFEAAAVMTFAHKGYAQSSVADICSASKLSRRQFYELYRDKEHMMRVVYDDINNRAQRVVVEAIDRHDPTTADDFIRSAIRAYVQSFGDRDRIRIAFIEAVGVSADFEKHRQETRESWASLIEALVERSEVVLGDGSSDLGTLGIAPWQALAFIGSVNAFVYEWATAESAPTVDELTETLAVILTALVSGG